MSEVWRKRDSPRDDDFVVKMRASLSCTLHFLYNVRKYVVDFY